MIFKVQNSISPRRPSQRPPQVTAPLLVYDNYYVFIISRGRSCMPTNPLFCALDITQEGIIFLVGDKSVKNTCSHFIVVIVVAKCVPLM